MTFEPGHPWHPPKNGRMPGRSRTQATAVRKLALEVRENIPPGLLVDFFTAIAMNHSPFWDEDPETGDMCVAWDERGGLLPTLEQRMYAVRWLAERGHGMPSQSIQLEAELNVYLTASQQGLQINACTPSQLAGIRALLEAPKPAPASRAVDNSDVEDAVFSEVGTASESASDTHDPLL